jgi:hypothetical protein
MNAYPTLAELAAMDAQAVFDHVVRHLLTQRRRCHASDGVKDICLYRGPHGTACAVGALIPAMCYAPEMEHRNVSSVMGWCMRSSSELHRRFGWFLSRHVRLLRVLQFLHDSRDPSQWPTRLREVATTTGLSARMVDVMMGASGDVEDATLKAEAAFREWMASLTDVPPRRIARGYEHVFV